MSKKTRILILAAALLSVPAAAQAAEQASFGAAPKGFKTGHQAGNGSGSIVELVPQKQDIRNWTQMVTQQTFRGNVQSAAGFRSVLSNLWQNVCPKSSITHLAEGEENGYPFALWKMSCADNPQTGKPEYTWVKAVRGSEGLYVKQYAFRYAPDSAQSNAAVTQLRDFYVCNNTPKHPCGAKRK